MFFHVSHLRVFILIFTYEAQLANSFISSSSSSTLVFAKNTKQFVINK